MSQATGKTHLAHLLKHQAISQRRGRSRSQPPAGHNTDTPSTSATHLSSHRPFEAELTPGRTRSETRYIEYLSTPYTRSRPSPPKPPFGFLQHKLAFKQNKTSTNSRARNLALESSQNSSNFPEQSDSEESEASTSEPDTPEPLEFEEIPDTYFEDIHHLFLEPEPVMATPQQIRLIIQETLGPLGPNLDQHGQIIPQDEQGHGTVPTLQQNLAQRFHHIHRKHDSTKPPGPSVFCGMEQENPMEFRERLTDYLAQTGIEQEAEKVRVAKMFLGGSALVWFKRLDPTPPATIANFWNSFDEKYVQGEAGRALLNDILSRQQGPTEDAMKYVDDIQEKSLQLAWDADRTRQQIITGLLPHIKQQVIIQNPATLDGTIALIRRIRNLHLGTSPESGVELSNIKQSLSEILTQMKHNKEEKKIAAVEQSSEQNIPQLAPVQQQQHYPTVPQPYNTQTYNTPQSCNMPQSFSDQQTFGQPQPYSSQPQQYKPPRKRFRNFTPQCTPPQPQPIIINTLQPQPVQTAAAKSTRGRQPRSGFTTRSDGCWSCGSPDHWKSACPMKQGYSTGPVMYNSPSQQQQTSGQPWSTNNTSGFRRRRGPGRGMGRGQPQPRSQTNYRNQGNF